MIIFVLWSINLIPDMGWWGMSNQWELLEQSVLDYMQDLHKRLIDVIGDDPGFKPKVYMHPLLKGGLLFGDAIQLNGKELEIETDSSLSIDTIWILDETLMGEDALRK